MIKLGKISLETRSSKGSCVAEVIGEPETLPV